MSLLIHSMAEFSDLILAVLELADCQSVVEIGSEAGGMTSRILQYVQRRKGWMTSIDPKPRPEAERLLRGTPFGILQRDTSLRALPTCPTADAYLIDGDHNYFTVVHELAWIERAQRAKGRPCLMLLHDVGWPCARRDMYYDPDEIPAEWLHPHSWTEGVTLDEPGTIPGGLCGRGNFAFARHEGGPRNGVLTAVEDFLEAAGPNYDFALIPAVFGLGIIYTKDAPWYQPVTELLAPYRNNSLLQTLERNRLENYLRVIELQDQPVLQDAGHQGGA